MSFEFNPHSDPVARHLHDASAELRGVRQEVWEASQPPEVRAEFQARRDAHARTVLWGTRLVFGGLAGFWLVAAVFGRTGTRLVGGALALAWQAFEVVLALGFFGVAAHTLWRGVRWLMGRVGGAGVRGGR